MEIAFYLVALAVAVLAVTALAERLDVPAPLLLIVAGVAASYVPGVPTVHLHHEVVLLGLLPPLLYATAIQTSLVDFNTHRRAILLLSVGLVVFTTLGVGVLVHALLPDIPWLAAIAIGAVVAPPDAVAATAIARRIGLPRRIVTILEGESLLNDATALVALRTAIGGAGAAAELWRVGADFVLAAGGGIVVGFLTFLLVAKLRKRITDPVLDTAISFVVPFASYIAAEKVHASGVIAVVVAGLLLGHKAQILQTAQSRIAERMNWRTIAYVLENTVFLLIGLQASWILADVGDSELSSGRIVAVCALTLLAVVLLRMVWVFLARYLLIRPGPDPETGDPSALALHLRPRLGRDARGGHPCGGVPHPGGDAASRDPAPDRVHRRGRHPVHPGPVVAVGGPAAARCPAPDPRDDALARATLLQQASKAGLEELERQELDDEHGIRRADPPADRRTELRRLGAARHGQRARDAERAVHPGPDGDDRGRTRAGAGDPERREGCVVHRRGGAVDAGRRGVDARPRVPRPRVAQERVHLPTPAR